MGHSPRFAIESPQKSSGWVRSFLEDVESGGGDRGQIAWYCGMLRAKDFHREDRVRVEYDSLKTNADLVLLPLLEPRFHDAGRFSRHAAQYLLELCNNPNAFVVHEFGNIPSDKELETRGVHLEACSVLRLYANVVGEERLLSREEALEKLLLMMRSECVRA